MKKIFFAFATMALMIAATSCNKQNGSNPNEPEVLREPEANEFCAEIAGGGVQAAPAAGGMTTKTTFSGLDVKWESGDVIKVQGKKSGTLDANWTDFTCEASANRAYFKNDAASPFSKDEYFAFYSSTVTPTSGAAGILSDTQIFDPSHPAANLPMYAYSTNHWLTFHNICAVLKITVPMTARYFTIENTSVAMNGAFTVQSNKAIMSNTNPSAPDLKLTVNHATANTNFNTNDIVYVAVPEGTYSGLNITFYDTNNKSVYTTGAAAQGKEKTFLANQIYNVKMPSNIFLKGEFSVSATKKVRFTSGNFYVVKNGSNCTYHIESTQENHPYTTSSAYDATHVDLLFYGTTAANSSAVNRPSGEYTKTFFCGGGSNTVAINGVSGLYCLSADEWDYILSDVNRKRAIKTIDTNKWFIIAPDAVKTTDIPDYTTLQQYTNEGYLCLCLTTSFIRYGASSASSNTFFHQRTGSSNEEIHLYTSSKDDKRPAKGICLYEDAADNNNPKYFIYDALWGIGGSAGDPNNDNSYARYVRLVQTVN